jgi:hypothetical protein
MKGTLQGDFSRFLFDRKKRYSAVRMQQGRVQLDADWNEQADILSERIRAGTADLVGPDGAPAGDAGFELIPERRCLELGVEQHHLLIGGAEGFPRPDFPPLPGHEPGLTVEIRVLPRTEGQLFSCWVRREQESRFRPVCSLRIENRRLVFERTGLADLVSGPREELIGRFHDVTASWGAEGVALWLDGEPVAEDRAGVRIPAGRFLFLVGARQEPFLAGLFEEVRLWNVRRTRDALAGQGPDREGGEAGDAGLLGHWRFDIEGDRPTTVPDLGPHGLDAVIRGSDAPPRWLPGELRIGAGRFYIDGVLCDNPEDVPFTAQPDAPGALLPQPRGREAEHHLFYLDVWERSISAIEDPGIREIALGGPDTTTRCQVVPQVKVLRLVTEEGRPSAAEIHRRWPELIAPEAERGKLLARRRQLATQRLENLLYRVEIHEGGDGRTAVVESVDAAAGKIVLVHWDHGWRPGQGVELFPFGAAPQDGPRRLARVTVVDPESRTLTVAGSLGPALGSADLRVRRIATFKWSRNNASVVFPIEKLDSGTRVVTLLPSARGTQGLEKGAWVELMDDRIALGGEANPLLRIERVDTLRQQVTLSPLPQGASVDPDFHPLLRVWDQESESGASAGDVTAWGVLPALGGDWQELEAGIQVRFQYDAPYRTGDYWWMPSRTSSQDVDWPRDSKGTPELLPPHGPEHRFSPLGLLTYEPEGFRLLDLRRTFHPWGSGAVSKAGDWMDGELDVRADARVRGDLEVEGSGTFREVWGPLRSRDAVDTPQIVDRSVTPEKLAWNVGTVPVGTAILGLGSVAPEGYEVTGWSTTLFSEAPRWIDRRQLPGGPPGPLVSAAVNGRIYSLLESGAFWEYEPRTDLWVRRRDVPVAGRGCAIAALNGKVYVAGGVDAAGRCSSRLFEYDPGRDDWDSRADLRTGRSSFGLVACRGRLHALGGLRDSPSGKCVTARHEAWDPASDTWSARHPLPQRVCAMGAAATDDRISIAGGETRVFQGRWGGGFTDDHHQYHPSADRWLPTRAPLPAPRRHARLVEVYGKLFSVGGEGAVGWLGDFDCYEPTVDGWVAQPALHEPIELPGVTSLDGTVYVAGALRNGGALMEECRVAARLRVLLREG